MALSEATQSRLENWKFASAAMEMARQKEEPTKHERRLVDSLAVFGNPGWFLAGQMEVIISSALSTIIEVDGY